MRERVSDDEEHFVFVSSASLNQIRDMASLFNVQSVERLEKILIIVQFMEPSGA